MSIEIAEARHVAFDLTSPSPSEVASRLRHLPGLVFFDSAGNLPSGGGGAISVIAARPERVVRGSIENVEVLEEILAEKIRPESGNGFPLGGLCGWVDYEGDFVFGVYPEMLAYCHTRQEWWEVGALSAELREAEDKNEMTWGDWKDSMPRAEFISAVERVQEYIRSGDIYQVNVSRRLQAGCSSEGSLFSLYSGLREASPAPLALYFNLDGREVLSSSPETFLQMSGKKIETRPIKGTRPRFSDPELDKHSADELQRSEKEAAELIMITDLERNDLGQVCEYGSVRVKEMLKLEKLAQVHHLVSRVEGVLRKEVSQVAALQACFPGGSITGAPKKRAMEIIAELESVPRGLYTGALGYLGFNGESQFNIAIRTLVREDEKISYAVGAGIVADSDAEAEYEETEQKAKGLRLALGQSTTGDT